MKEGTEVKRVDKNGNGRLKHCLAVILATLVLATLFGCNNNRRPGKDTQDSQEAICDSIVDKDEDIKAIYMNCMDYLFCYTRGIYYRFVLPNSKAVEKITGVEFPHFKVVEFWPPIEGHNPNEWSIGLDFDEIPNEAFYEELAKHAKNNHKKDKYVFTRYYDSSFKFYDDVPVGSWVKGTVTLKITKGHGFFMITIMEWK
jgi:hypothetical protein